MSTRCFVGIMTDNVCRAIYVHFDGYLDGVGAELQQYKTRESVLELIESGDRSELTSGFYKDNGETDVEPREYKTFEEFYDNCKDSFGEWYYIFKNGRWYCGNTHESSALCRKLVPYVEAVEIYEAERD